ENGYADVGPGDGQDRRRSVRRRRDHAAGTQAVLVRVPRQELPQVLGHRDRADARTAAAAGDAEGLVQAEVAHVAGEASRTGHPDEGVEVGAVDVHLPAGVVDDPADLLDVVLVDTVGRRVGDHDRGERTGVCVHLLPQVVDVDV